MDAKTQALTQTISDLNISPGQEDKKDSQSLGHNNPFMRIMSQEEESLHSKPVPIFAQIAESREPPVRPDMGGNFFTQLSKVEAAHQLSQTFEREMTKPEMIELYTKAYKWHTQEAVRYKSLLDQVARSLTQDLDDHMLQPLPWGVNEQMKQMLEKKKDQL